MHSNGRLKLGPKRRDGAGFNRINKTQNEHKEVEQSMQAPRLALFPKNSNIEDNDTDREKSSRRLNVKPVVQQINLMGNRSLSGRESENGGLTDRSQIKESG